MHDHDAPSSKLTTPDDQQHVAAATPAVETTGTDATGPPPASQHHSLKYHLLGPSLTKAGQDGVDQKKISEIIFEASKGSKFFNNEEVKDKNLTEKINRILARKRQLDRLDLSHDRRKADDLIAELELSRDLSQHIVHLDCDAFYAAVEELDRPDLKDKPFAVGKGVLTTCNYVARQYGCRSAMAGFVALKLCPDLIFLPLNFEKYTAKAEEVRSVIALYDPNFESASIDEAYLNITEYCKTHEMDPSEAVAQLRREVHEKAKITVSAGIAPNAKLAKIGSNQNKPNGQYRVSSDRATIINFMRDLPTRKVNGVGRVLERELDAIGIKTCGNIYEYRAYLNKLFGEKTFHFLMQCYLGLGRTTIQPPLESGRKSVGTESTFGDLSGKKELRDKLQHIAEELQKDLERTQYKGRTLCLKIKLHTYEVFTRQVQPPKAVNTAEDLYKYAEPMLAKLEKEFPNMKLRLMGLRVTHIVSTKKGQKDFFGLKRATSTDEQNGNVHDDGWEKWPDTEFEDAARQEREDEMDEMEALSQEQEAQELLAANPRHTTAFSKNNKSIVVRPTSSPKKKEEFWACPVCSIPQPANDKDFNEHIDLCLSRQTIKEAVQEDDTSTSRPTSEVKPLPQRAAPSKKRGRPRQDAATTGHDHEKRKRFFFSPST